MHVIIAGDSDVATNIAELLMEDHEVVLVGDRSASGARLDRLDVEWVQGEPTMASVLLQARVERCGVFVAATDNDEVNLVSCIAARNLGSRRTICLLTRPGFVAVSDGEEALAQSLGIDAVVRPADQLAREVLRIVTVPGALDMEHLVHGKVRLLRHSVEADAPLAGQPLKRIPLPANVVLVMGRRGEEVFVPNGDTTFLEGDKVTAVGTPRGIHELRYRFLRSRSHGRDIEHATIVGGGTVGLLVARGLEANGWKIKLIEIDRERCDRLAPQLKGLVLCGDGTDIALLEEEQVARSPVLIAVTSNDERNLLVSLIARNLGVERIITRADRLSNERMFERVGIDVVRSARGAAIRTVVRDVVGVGRNIRAELEHGDMAIVEMELPADHPNVRIRELAAPIFAIIATVIRDKAVIIPNGETVLRGGDHLLVFTARRDEAEARAHFLRVPARDQPPLPRA